MDSLQRSPKFIVVKNDDGTIDRKILTPQEKKDMLKNISNLGSSNLKKIELEKKLDVLKKKHAEHIELKKQEEILK